MITPFLIVIYFPSVVSIPPFIVLTVAISLCSSENCPSHSLSEILIDEGTIGGHEIKSMFNGRKEIRWWLSRRCRMSASPWRDQNMTQRKELDS